MFVAMSYYLSMYVPLICNVHELKISYDYQCRFAKWHYYTSYFSHSIDATIMILDSYEKCQWFKNWC
jgi:hypothetical protein